MRRSLLRRSLARWAGRPARVLLLVLPISLAACGDDGTGPDTAAGTYELARIDGEAVPVVLCTGAGCADLFGVEADTVRILSGRMTLDRGTFTARMTAEYAIGGVGASPLPPVETTGTYTVRGDRVTFQPSGASGAETTGTLSGDTLRVSETIGGRTIQAVYIRK